MAKEGYTRGHGFGEKLLSNLRCKQINKLLEGIIGK